MSTPFFAPLPAADTNKHSAMLFTILMGVVSLTRQGAGVSRGRFCTLLGANAATGGFVAGLGELVGYGLRIVSGIITGRTG